MNKTAFWGFEFIVCMTFEVCTTLITPQRYLIQERLSHNYRGLKSSEITGGGVTIPPPKNLQCKGKAYLE